MDNKLLETTKLCEEIMKRKRQVKEKLGHVVQIRVCRNQNQITRINSSVISKKKNVLSTGIRMF